MKFRVLHAPTSVGGNALGLSRALERLGVESRSLVVSQNFFMYDADIVLHHPNESLFLRELRRIGAILFELPKCDIVHYNFGTSISTPFLCEDSFSWRGCVRYIFAAYLRLLQRFEFAYVKLLGLRVFVTYQGSDARQGDYCLKNFDVSFADRVEAGFYSAGSDRFKRQSIARFERFAQKIYAVNPDLLHVLPRNATFVPYSHIDLDEWLPSYTQEHRQPIRILHAPTHRLVKGTDVIIEVLETLRSEGFEFELILVEGLSNHQARKLYERADILIDQLFAGWYGGLAVELMALGKPVLAYIREDDLRFVDPELKNDLPIVNVTSDTLIDALRNILTMPRSELVDLGRRSRQYVEKWHDPLRIAARIKRDYEEALSQAMHE